MEPTESLGRTAGNGWTGGQYSLFRAVFGVYLLAHFVSLIPWAAEIWSSAGVMPDAAIVPTLVPVNIFAWIDGPRFVTAVVVAAAALSVAFAIGFGDRMAAVAMWYILACLFGRNPLTLNPSLPFVAWMLLAHACLPAAPFGSWAARGRPDPGAGWRFPPALFAAAWILMALGYSYSGYTKLTSPSWVDGTAIARVLDNPLARPTFLRDWMLALPLPIIRGMTWAALGLELLFAPLALIRRARPWLWAAMLSMHLGLMTLIDFADLSAGMVMLHLFTFNPAWVRPRSAAGQTLFYDGGCGLCHRMVRLVLAEQQSEPHIRFAPLGGRSFEERVRPDVAGDLPDSLVLRSADGELLFRTRAVLHILERLGGYWRVLAIVGRIVPNSAADWVYDRVAAVRHRLFRKPSAACPILPAALRERFDA